MNGVSCQLDLFGGDPSPPQVPSGDAFGCCDRCRACSDAGACLFPDAGFSASCQYRRVLEGGHVFYGKHADGFRPEVYAAYCERYRALPASQAACLRAVLRDFFVRRRGARSGMFKLADVSACAALSRAGFFRLTSDPAKVLPLCTDAAISAACGDRIAEADEWARARCPAGEWEKRRPRRGGVRASKGELTRWILACGPEIAAVLSRDVYFISLEPDTRRELEEFYLDFLSGGDTPPPLDDCREDPRFMSAAPKGVRSGHVV